MLRFYRCCKLCYTESARRMLECYLTDSGWLHVSIPMQNVDRYRLHNSISDRGFWRTRQQLIHGGLEAFHDDRVVC